MTLGRIITGFDIGESSVKMVQVSGKEIKKSLVCPLPDNMVEADRIISMDAMADFIRQNAKINELPKGDAAVILPSSRVFVKNVTVPYMTEQQLVFNLPFEFKDYLKEEKSKYLFDYVINEITNDEEGKPYEMRIFACAVLKETVEEYRRMFARAGFKLKMAVPAEYAYMNIIGTLGEDAPKDCCIADLGHHGTRLHIFHDGEYSTRRNIEIGVSGLDEIISEAEGVDIHMARTYKESDYEGVLGSDAALQLYNNLAVEITKAVNFFNYNNRNAELQDIYLSGGGVAIEPLKEMLQKEIHMQIHEAEELAPALGSTSKPYAALEAYGLAIGKINQDKYPAKKTINMMNCGLPAQTAKILSIGLVAIAILVALVVKVGVIDQFGRLSDAENAYNEVHAQNIALDEKIKDYDEVSIQYRAYSKNFLSGDEEGTVRVDRQKVLDLIEAKMMSRGEVLTISISDNTAVVNMSGMNLEQISRMNTALEKSPIVKEVSLKIAQTEQNRQASVLNFTVTIHLQAEEANS